MTTKRHPADTELGSSIRMDSLRNAWQERLVGNANPLELIESVYRTHRALLERIDRVVFRRTDPEELFDYAVRIKFCLPHLTQLEQDIATLKSGGIICLPQTIGSMAYLGGELTGMKYSILEEILE